MMRNNFFFLTKIFLAGVFLLCCPQIWALKVVSLSPAVTELICYLGKKDVLAGRSSACNYPREVADIPVMGDFARLSVPRILALRPDVVITNELIVPGAAKNFKRAGIKLLHLPCRSLEDYRQLVRRTGEIIGAEKAAEAEIRRIDDWVVSFQKKPRIKKKVLCFFWHKPPIASGEKTLIHELITLAGGENCHFNGVKGFFKPSAQFLAESRADMILVFSPLEGYKNHPVFKKLPAVRAGKIFEFPEPDALQRPGPRLTRGVQILREILEK